MLDYSPVSRLGFDPKDGRLASNGKYLTFNCSRCVERGEPRPDNKRRLHICVDPQSSVFGIFHCFRCGYSGKVKKRGAVELDLSILKRREFVAPKPQEVEVKLPPDFVPLTPDMHAYAYLIKRGLTEDDIRYYDVGIAKGRIYFPDFDLKGNLSYWVARAYDKSLPKYLNCPASRERQIYNLSRWFKEKFDTLTICEGAISAICAGRDAVATYGKLLSPSQVEILKSLPAKKVYVALDPDAKKETIKLGKELMNCFDEVYLVPMPRKEDPASLGRNKFIEIKNLKSLRLTEAARDVPVRFLLGS